MYCSSQIDGTICIVSTSCPLRTRLILFCLHLRFLRLLAASLLHNYGHLFLGSYVRFSFGLSLLFLLLYFSLDHDTYKLKPT
jgi:hypothetical protein